MPTDKCRMDAVMASCQHIKFIDRKKVTIVNGKEQVTIEKLQEVPPGRHILFGASVYVDKLMPVDADDAREMVQGPDW